MPPLPAHRPILSSETKARIRRTWREWDTRASGWMTPVVKWTVYLSIALYLLMLILPFRGGLIPMFGASPDSTILHLRIWQLITYALLHDPRSILHILLNLLGLWFFGTRLEAMWGSTWFLRLWIVSALGCALVHILVALLCAGLGKPEMMQNYIIGLSGVVYGVLAAYASIRPNDVIYIYGILPIRVRLMVIILGVLAFIGAASGSDGVAHLGHLGGILFGWLFVRYPRVFNRLPVPRIGHRKWRPGPRD